DLDGARIAVPGNGLDTGDRTHAEKREHGRPVVGRPVAKQDGEIPRRSPGAGRFPRRPGARAIRAKRARGTTEEVAETLVEPPDTAESGRHGDFGHRETRFVNELFREEHPTRLRDGDGRGAEMPLKETPELPLTEPEALGERLHIAPIEGAH